MNTPGATVLHLEKDESTRFLLEIAVRREGLQYHGFSNVQDFNAAISARIRGGK
jgi:DNA-binding NtrC family response regulator